MASYLAGLVLSLLCCFTWAVGLEANRGASSTHETSQKTAEIHTSKYPLIVHYPVRESGGVNEWIFSYFEELLTLIMSNSGVDYKLQPVLLKDKALNRNILYLQRGVYDVSFLATSTEREAQLRPIRIPIYRGLIGWRLLFVTGEGQDKLRDVKSLEQLAQFYAGQGYTWPDTEVLEAAGMRVRTAVNHYSLFQMLEANRIDYFPRSIIEIQNELEFVKDWVQIESNLVLSYPAAYYLFVSPENKRLAVLLENGFEKIIADGSLFKLFVKYFKKPILAANLDKRRVLYLENKVIPKDTPVGRKELWFGVDDVALIK
ncbi:ABC-type amino acid transport substrate-binding protein [Alteromonadaceae bacterium 2753L.S.0a.02]|nr:ABC-type amino acid transport substrate-binding protein [Alteromonadaceae bacterium 2753L.S.0a.02]